MTVRKVLVKGRGFNWRHAAEGFVLGVMEIAAVTAVIFTFGKVVPAYALTSLYVLAMLPIAVGWGFGAALLFAFASTVAFDLVISPPTLSVTATDADTAVLLVISCVTAYVVSNLAARVQRRAREAEALAQEVQRFAEEQAALRRVATLVARAAHPDEVFAAVTAEVGQLLAAEVTILERYESTSPSGAVVLGVWTSTESAPTLPVGQRVELEGTSVATEVYNTDRPARVNAYPPHGTPAAARALGVCAAVGAPISVDGRGWGVMIVGSAREPLSPDTETRLAAFTELVATAIANAAARAALTASRTRIVATADNTRRRIERDLHDGTQQRLVSLALRLRAAQAAVPPQAKDLEEQLDSLAGEATSALDELREFARGIHPAILAEGGLSPALKTLARRATVPVELDLHVRQRLPEQIEVAAYFIVSEALTNAAKYARASVVHVEAGTEEDADHDRVLHVCVCDDGRGGADFSRGSGLVGLKDRVEALGGRIDLQSAPDEGTRVQVDLPLGNSHRPSSGP